MKVVSPRLKTYLDSQKHESVLLGEVDRHLQLVVDDRNPSVIHPSEMSKKDWCHRATWYRLTGRRKKPEAIGLRSNLIFSEGHQIHRKWQGWLSDMGILWGRWQCAACLEVSMGWSNEIIALCPALPGRLHLWEYREVPLELPSHRIAGHADGIVNPTGREAVLLEVKSVGPGTLRVLDLLTEHDEDDLSSGKFSKITRPTPPHFRQTQLYMRLSENWKGDIGPVDRAVIIYEHKADQQVREFVVERNDRWTDPLFSAAMDIVWAIDKGREVKCPVGGCAQCRAYEED